MYPRFTNSFRRLLVVTNKSIFPCFLSTPQTLALSNCEYASAKTQNFKIASLPYRCIHTKQQSCFRYTPGNSGKHQNNTTNHGNKKPESMENGSMPHNNKLRWWVCFGLGTGLGCIAEYLWNQSQRSKAFKNGKKDDDTGDVEFIIPWKKSGLRILDAIKNEVSCAPFPPQRLLMDPLKTLQNPPSDPVELIKHNFQWEHTMEAAGIDSSVSQAEVHRIAMTRSHTDWNIEASKIFPKEYGARKVHHIILDNIENIVSDLKTRKELLSVDRANYVWVSETKLLATLIYDKDVNNYRVYVYRGFVALKVVADTKGNLVIPSEIVFISDAMKPKNAPANDSYMEEIVMHFDEDFLQWQKCASFLY